MKPPSRVTGIGGISFKAQNADELRAWYWQPPARSEKRANKKKK
jgi:hypothetical protein